MAQQIHPTAVVDPAAQIHSSARVGPFCVVGPDVELGPEVQLHSHVVVMGPTTLGSGCQIHPFAVLGGPPQDRKYANERSDLIIGRDVEIREHATIHGGTAGGTGRTTIGDRALLMAYSHVAHDCEVGSDVVMTNGATLAGHVTVESHAVLGGFAAVGQMLRVGESAMLAAGAMVEQDAPPYCTVAGDRAKVRAVNVIGLRRRGLSTQAITAIKQAFRVLFRGEQPLNEALDAARHSVDQTAEVTHLLRFIEESRKGVCR